MPDPSLNHPACGRVVYLDRRQAQFFEPNGWHDFYYGDTAEWVGTAAALLRSADYDQPHRDILEPLGDRHLVLRRVAGQNPGWFTIERVGN